MISSPYMWLTHACNRCSNMVRRRSSPHAHAKRSGKIFTQPRIICNLSIWFTAPAPSIVLCTALTLLRLKGVVLCLNSASMVQCLAISVAPRTVVIYTRCTPKHPHRCPHTTRLRRQTRLSLANKVHASPIQQHPCRP